MSATGNVTGAERNHVTENTGPVTDTETIHVYNFLSRNAGPVTGTAIEPEDEPLSRDSVLAVVLADPAMQRSLREAATEAAEKPYWRRMFEAEYRGEICGHCGEPLAAGQRVTLCGYGRRGSGRAPVCDACVALPQEARLIRFWVNGTHGTQAREHACQACGRPVVLRWGSRRLYVYCSERCAQAIHRSRRRRQGPQETRCATCAGAFVPARADARYCCAACRQKAYRQREGPRMSSTTTVVHMRDVRPGEEGVAYVGRAVPRRGIKASLFGNPFKVGREAATNADAKAMYADWLAGRAHQDTYPEIRAWILENVRTLRGKRLACWCFPQACHADVLAELADAGADA